jgi:hypothetical protein
MLEIVAEGDTEAHGAAGGCPLVATIPGESGHSIILPRRPGEPRFAPRQYCYAASKSGVMPSLPLTASGVSQRDESSEGQRDAT